MIWTNRWTSDCLPHKKQPRAQVSRALDVFPCQKQRPDRPHPERHKWLTPPVMETQAGDAGAFKQFDLSRVPSPCFVIDKAAIRRNLSILSDVGKQADVKVLLALKAFSCWALGDLVGEYLDGTCASGLWEAKLAREKFSGELATYSAGFKLDEIPEILELSDHLIFNSPAQLERFSPQIIAARNWGYAPDFGLRINPEHSEGAYPEI